MGPMTRIVGLDMHPEGFVAVVRGTVDGADLLVEEIVIRRAEFEDLSEEEAVALTAHDGEADVLASEMLDAVVESFWARRMRERGRL